MRQRHSETERQRHSETERQRHSETERKYKTISLSVSSSKSEVSNLQTETDIETGRQRKRQTKK